MIKVRIERDDEKESKSCNSPKGPGEGRPWKDPGPAGGLGGRAGEGDKMGST